MKVLQNDDYTGLYTSRGCKSCSFCHKPIGLTSDSRQKIRAVFWTSRFVTRKTMSDQDASDHEDEGSEQHTMS